MESYSQIGQDKWVLSLFPKGYRGFFMDVGCHLPEYINNTLLLEEQGWDGVAFDKKNYYWAWRKRRVTKFFWTDVLFCDFKALDLPKQIDYLSLDIDGKGTNYTVLKKLLKLGFKFGSITFEHNLYLGEEYNLAERIPQRELLLNRGYTLARADVKDDGDPLKGEGNVFEDWWVDKKYIDGLDTRG